LRNEEEADEQLFKNYTDEKTNFPLSKFYKELIKKIKGKTEEEEHKDVSIYKTLRYPIKSKLPTSN
jgi:hypothetical protein